MIFLTPILPPHHSDVPNSSFVAIVGEKYGPSKPQRLNWVRIDAFGTIAVVRQIDVPANASADLSADGTMVLISSASGESTRLLLYGLSGAPFSATFDRIDRGTMNIEISPSSKLVMVSWNSSAERAEFQVFSRTLKSAGRATASAESRAYWTMDGRVKLSGKVIKTIGDVFADRKAVSASFPPRAGQYPNQDESLTYDASAQSFTARSGKRIRFRPYSGVLRFLWADKNTFVFSGSDYSGALKPRHYSVLQQIRWNPESESFGPAEVLYRGGSGFPEGDPSLTFPSTPIGVLDDGVVVVDTRQDGDKIVWLKDRLPYTLCQLPAGDRGFRAVQLIGPKK